MSAHMLDNEKFQDIADWLYMEATRKPSPFVYPVKVFLGFENGSDLFHDLSLDLAETAVKFKMRQLYNLNRLALVTRYSETYDARDETKFLPNHEASEKPVVEILRMLSSLIYQCSEYMTSTTDLYKALRVLVSECCRIIVLKVEG